MKIRSSLALKNTLAMGLILLLVMGAIYLYCARSGYPEILELRETLIALFIIALILLLIINLFLARLSLRPIRKITREAEKITANHIDQRLLVKNPNDELGELCMEINKLLDRMELVFNSQKTFISNASHELRTPLTAIISELDLTTQKKRTEKYYKHSIENALEDAHRMTKLIDGLLNLVEADYNEETIQMREIRLDELLLDARGYILRAHPDYNIELLFEQEEAEDDSHITVMGNPYLLGIAFSNLIENNCKYSENRSSFIQISFWDRWSVIRFSDNGIGMSEKDIENIFKMFYRGDDANPVEGHGIGMALVQKIIKIHSGTTTVHSEEKKGTTFIVELPHV